MQLIRRTLTFAAPLLPALALGVVASRAQTPPASDRAGASNYLVQTLALGSLAKRHSELAVARAREPLVKAFAEREIAEQLAVASVLAVTRESTKTATLDPKHQDLLDRLAATPDGEEFDLTYIETQITIHNDLLAAQQTLSGDRDPSAEAITARLVEQVATSHIATLNLIQQLVASEHIQELEQMKDQPVPQVSGSK